MIRIQRPDERLACPELAEVREHELARVRPLVGVEGPHEELLGTKYRYARSALYMMQHYKCCYCEELVDSVRFQPVEHFRPKCAAVRAADHKDPGYWWLTWTWSNLFFACRGCNTDRGAHFPLVDGIPALQPEEQPPGNEQPLLLDPCVDDPREHIQFRPEGPYWMPYPRDGSARGEATLRALGFYHPRVAMKRTGLLERWRQHARSLEPAVGQIRAALRSRDPAHVRREWSRTTAPHRVVFQPFVALTLDVLDHEFPAPVRDQWSLELTPIFISRDAGPNPRIKS